ncbi:MAG: hypothetical protein ACFE8G_02015, partial [Candidatus Hermodarchaeota archaeon]
GEGIAKIEGNEIIYEFSIPVEVEESVIEDVKLDHGVQFDFKIVLGKTAIYPDGIIISNIFSIELEYPQKPPPDISEIIMVVSTIIVFAIIAGLYIFYLYQITQLKKKIRRIRT